MTTVCIATTTHVFADVRLSTVPSPQGDATDYYTDGDSLLNTDLTIGGNYNLFVGKSYVAFSPLATPSTLTVKSTVNISGTDLAYAYQGYFSSTKIDVFTVTGSAVVPGASMLALLLPSLGILGFALGRRRK